MIQKERHKSSTFYICPLPTPPTYNKPHYSFTNRPHLLLYNACHLLRPYYPHPNLQLEEIDENKKNRRKKGMKNLLFMILIRNVR